MIVRIDRISTKRERGQRSARDCRNVLYKAAQSTPFCPLPGMKKAACGWRQRGSEADITGGLFRYIFLC
jgi:hypothetical protein